jgi:putative Holliday junction resolvase
MNQKQLREIRGTGIVDSRAAAIILQDYLDQRFPPNPELTTDFTDDHR